MATLPLQWLKERRLFVLGALLLVAAAGVALATRDRDPAAPAATDDRPVVLIMDSPHAARVYDPETLAANGTNADVIRDILVDLPIDLEKEAIGSDWQRAEEIRRFDPDLIVIHWSGFCEDTCADRAPLQRLVDYFAQDATRFLIYSRMGEDSLRIRVDSLLQTVEGEHPGILRRIDAFGVTDHGPPYWRDPVTASALELRVQALLGLR